MSTDSTIIPTSSVLPTPNSNTCYNDTCGCQGDCGCDICMCGKRTEEAHQKETTADKQHPALADKQMSHCACQGTGSEPCMGALGCQCQSRDELETDKPHAAPAGEQKSICACQEGLCLCGSKCPCGPRNVSIDNLKKESGVDSA
ncbi:hypothetical protein BC938DRAFT_474631 [Jimgerdemannia flammicorona]|uniref:Uncharacterized protein n=1 Tax=Jimgerdemannia flammicorona TaxID=994334 RepID=A0A433Q1U1_9FUNG|nr:hypothetical protein BC938DRAFT_474631 [Jimgerdemannia flammicorona]